SNICDENTIFTEINSIGNIVFLIRLEFATTLPTPRPIASAKLKKGINPQNIKSTYSYGDII
ncbi:hypothetical protein, partial [Campylobacter concisus]|uniref:hypothetical protein n=1 Tax=Campylobacter concisus TaxID=199 RepID=UPI001A7E63D2